MAFLGQNPYQVSQFCFTIRVCSILVLISDCVTIQYGTLRCGAVRCSAVRCGTGAVRYGTRSTVLESFCTIRSSVLSVAKKSQYGIPMNILTKTAIFLDVLMPNRELHSCLCHPKSQETPPWVWV